MKTLFRLICLLVCIIFLFATCRHEETEVSENHLFYYSYTGIVESSTDSNVQIGDSTYHYHYIDGTYGYYRGRFNKNSFNFSMQGYHLYPFIVTIDTEIIDPNLFFKEGIRKIDSIHILNAPLMIGGSYRTVYYPTNSVFSWDSVSYAIGTFKGKGSLEIKDTLYINYPESIYLPPQKIEFEFK